VLFLGELWGNNPSILAWVQDVGESSLTVDG